MLSYDDRNGMTSECMSLKGNYVYVFHLRSLSTHAMATCVWLWWWGLPVYP